MNDPEKGAPTLWIVGYGAWPVSVRAERLVAALARRGVTRLVDVRLNPTPSSVKPGPYGPKPWTLQAGRSGIVGLLGAAGIAYEWLVELGNPQRQDPAMAVLREHLADPYSGWPVHRGLERLAALVRRPEEAVALLWPAPITGRVIGRWSPGAGRACHFDGRRFIRDLQSGELIETAAARPVAAPARPRPSRR